MNVCRLNLSHGTHEEHADLIKRIRQVSEETTEPLVALMDLQGPKIRTGVLPKEGVPLVEGGEIVFTTDPEAALPRVTLTYDGLHRDVKHGDRLLLDDGLYDVTVKEVRGRDIVCSVIHGGTLFSHKGINLPTATLSIPAITEKDKVDVEFGVRQGVDWVALSFVRNAKEIFDLRYMIKEYEKSLPEERQHEPAIRIIAKIEKHEAVKHIDEIIDAADGIMVARGDLGIEMPAEEVPLIQKRIIDRCLAASKPVIVATQMLESMTRNPRPTRAEVSDVANAVSDGADAIMLSGETAIGKYPLRAVEMMTRIAKETEGRIGPDFSVFHDSDKVEDALSKAVCHTAYNIKANAIITCTLSG